MLLTFNWQCLTLLHYWAHNLLCFLIFLYFKLGAKVEQTKLCLLLVNLIQSNELGLTDLANKIIFPKANACKLNRPYNKLTYRTLVNFLSKYYIPYWVYHTQRFIHLTDLSDPTDCVLQRLAFLSPHSLILPLHATMQTTHSLSGTWLPLSYKSNTAHWGGPTMVSGVQGMTQ